jgi:hypothetical protein
MAYIFDNWLEFEFNTFKDEFDEKNEEVVKFWVELLMLLKVHEFWFLNGFVTGFLPYKIEPTDNQKFTATLTTSPDIAPFNLFSKCKYSNDLFNIFEWFF